MITGDAMARPLLDALDDPEVQALDLSSWVSLSSTAAQVVAAINANAAASALVKALTFQNNTGGGTAPATRRINLSDFLSVSASSPASGIPHDNSHVERGPFQPKVMRIGKTRFAYVQIA